MRKYSIFYRERGNFYPVFKQNKEYWLGGTRCEWLLFGNKAEAEAEAKKVRKQKLPFLEKGTVSVYPTQITPILHY